MIADNSNIEPKQSSPSKESLAPSTNEDKSKIIPDFEQNIVSTLTSEFSDKIETIYIRPMRIKVRVQPEDIISIATFIKSKLGFDHAESVAGVDFPKDNQIEVVYHLGSYSRDDLSSQILALATRTNRDDARLPSLINVFKSVEYHERETFEMIGVYFEGHPRNERFLLPEDWADIPPLRKEFRIKGR